MTAAEGPEALRAARAAATARGLRVEDAVVLHASNALTVRLLPCDVVARVARPGRRSARFQVDLAVRLAERGAPVAVPDPRVGPHVHEVDGFTVTLWTHHPAAAAEVAPAPYAAALTRFHAAARGLDVAVPRFTERVEQAQRLLADRERTPDLDRADREFLATTVERLGRQVAASGAAEQVLHGEPHPGNVLAAEGGPVFVDLETCCRGPVEFDLAHAPEEVATHCPGLDQALLRRCRVLVLAVVTTWRWDRDDRFPDGRRLGREWLADVRAAVARDGGDHAG
ncbi:phosphotransferase enzyme family protein [Kineococcus sp. SYSU DK004]|uniref:phosphotransferase enzyme family protein n=1 Tax=Kineococcus sp. SYSU DK004 TaxID=3383125 RepID=UPI003D7CA5E5